MSRRVGISLSIAFFLCCGTLAQTIYRWNTDSIRLSLQQVFPNATSIQLINSVGEDHSDSIISGWAAKAAILDAGDSNKISFYFFTINDTSVIRKMMVASLNSMVASAKDSTTNKYVFSFPFIDSSGSKAIMYYTTPNRDADYYAAMEQRICTSFRVPHYKDSLKIEVHVKEVTLDSTMKPPPPPPPPLKKKKRQ